MQITGFNRTQIEKVDGSFSDYVQELPTFSDITGFNLGIVFFVMLLLFVGVGLYKYYN